MLVAKVERYEHVLCSELTTRLHRVGRDRLRLAHLFVRPHTNEHTTTRSYTAHQLGDGTLSTLFGAKMVNHSHGYACVERV